MNKAKASTLETFIVPRIRGLRESGFWLLAGVGVILLLALLTYSPVDPAFSVAGGTDTIANRMGPAGAWFADVAFVLFGVSAYQIHLGARPITTAGDAPHVLVAFNPAALKVNLPLLSKGALIVLNIDSFTTRNLAKAGYDKDPRQSGVLDGYQIIEVDITKHTLEATEPFGLSKSDAGRCKNFWALGLVQWMFNRDVGAIEDFRTDGLFASEGEQLARQLGRALGRSLDFDEVLAPWRRGRQLVQHEGGVTQDGLVIDGLPSNAGIAIGAAVSTASVPAGAVVTGILGRHGVSISAAATASGPAASASTARP